MKRDCYIAGFNSFIEKPIITELFLQLILKHIKVDLLEIEQEV